MTQCKSWSIVKGGLTPGPLPCIFHWRSSPRLSDWKHENVAAMASCWGHCADLTYSGIKSQIFRTDSLCAKLTVGTGPEIEPKTTAPIAMSLVNLNWLVWLIQNYDIASGTSVCVATILFQEYLLRWNAVLSSYDSR